MHLLKLSLLLDLVHIALPSDLTVLFFLLLVYLTHAFLLINAFFGLLAYTLYNILALLLIGLPALSLLTSLDLKHIVLLIPVLLSPRLQLLLSFDPLVV